MLQSHVLLLVTSLAFVASFSSPVKTRLMALPCHPLSTPCFPLQFASTSLSETKSNLQEKSGENGKETTVKSAASSRLRRLKDLMWVRETLEDLTAAEFACSVEMEKSTSKKRAVDYEKLLTLLNRRIRDLGCDMEGKQDEDDFDCTLDDEKGMGRLVYSQEERKQLLKRIMTTRSALIALFQGDEDADDEGEGSSQFAIQLPEISIPKVEIPKDKNNTSSGPKLYVRDDGTVDWDGALQDQAALRKFGTAVWARINGQDPEAMEDDPDGKKIVASTAGHGEKKQVTAKIEETPQIKQAREKLEKLASELYSMEVAHTKLLNSALRNGQVVANVNLASVEPAQRNQIRESADELEQMKEAVSFQSLIYDMERIDTYLMGELNPALKGYISLQDRLNVAEFGLLESQIESFNYQLENGDVLDTDVVAVVSEQVADFKRRLGIDYSVSGVSFDPDAIKRLLSGLLEQTKKGLSFYATGFRLFWNDILFVLSLVNRAAQGYTLKPREVRTIRRTFKDMITFVPFIIIWLIPLTPVGHVFVFGAIQRFFPDFFPSSFTEQRQNLLQLYENAEYSEFTIDENWKEKVTRLVEAFAYFAANSVRNLYNIAVAAVLRRGEADSSEDGNATNKKR